MTQTKEPGPTIGMVPPWRQWLPFAVIANLEDARRIARRAAITGYLLLIVGIIDMALSLAGYVMLPRTIIDLTGSSMVAVVLLQSVGFVLLWFLVSRVATARGYICAALLAMWLALHVWDSALDSGTHVIFSIGYAVMTLLMVDGVRACWIGARAVEPAQT